MRVKAHNSSFVVKLEQVEIGKLEGAVKVLATLAMIPTDYQAKATEAQDILSALLLRLVPQTEDKPSV